MTPQFHEGTEQHRQLPGHPVGTCLLTSHWSGLWGVSTLRSNWGVPHVSSHLHDLFHFPLDLTLLPPLYIVNTGSLFNVVDPDIKYGDLKENFQKGL